MKENTRCAVVYREKRSHEWQLMVWTERVSVALKSARTTNEQEHRLGNKSFEAKAMNAKDWMAGRTRAKITDQEGDTQETEA